MWIAGGKGAVPRASARGACGAGYWNVIPKRLGQVKYEGRRGLNKAVSRGRSVEERTVGHLKENHRIVTRFEMLATSFLGMLKLAFLTRYLAFLMPNCDVEGYRMIFVLVLICYV